MIAQWMLYAVLLGLAVSVVTVGAEYALRLYGRSTRWLWATSLVAALVLPLAAWLLTSPPAPVQPGAMGEPIAISALPAAAPAAPAAPVRLSAWTRLAGLEGRIDGGLPWIWLGTSLVAMLALAFSYLRLRRQRRRWAEADVDGLAVLVSGGTGPAVVGLRRARIVVPEWVLQEPEARRRLILAHEAEHLAAGDARLLTGALAALVAAPWNPLVWWQIRRLRLAAEVDCDARVLRRGADLRGYAGLLLDVGMRFGEGGALAAFAEPRSLLARRLRALTAPLPRRRGWRVAALTAACLGVAALACFSPRPDKPLPTEPIGRAEPVAVSDMPTDTSGPHFTPYTVAPELVNRDTVRRALVESYPPLQKAAGIGGVIAAWAHIDRSGRVVDARVKKSSGEPALDSAALHVTRMMRFDPAKNGVTTVDAWVVLPIVFKTVESAPPGTVDDKSLAQRVGLIPPGVAPTPEEIRRGPTFTPFTVMPELANREEVRAALVKEYPPELKAAGKGGTVMTWALVGENGAVEQALVKKSSNDAQLDSAAVRVARSMRFTPAQNAGKPALVWVMLPIIFRTEAQEAEARTQVNAEYAGLPPADSKYGIPGLPEGYTPPTMVNGQEVTSEFRGAFPQGVQVPHWAWVRLSIAADGSSSDFTLFKSSGNAQFDALALSAVRKIRFGPALNASGQPAPVTGYVPIPPVRRPAAPSDSGSPRADAGKRPNVAALVAPLAATVVVHK